MCLVVVIDSDIRVLMVHRHPLMEDFERKEKKRKEKKKTKMVKKVTVGGIFVRSP